MSEQSGTSEYLKIVEAARFLGVTQRWVYRRISSGELPASRVGGLYFVRRSDLQNLLEKARVIPAGEPPELEPAVSLQKCGYCFGLIEPGADIQECKTEGCGKVICERCASEGVEYCAGHSPTREQRLQEAQEQFDQKKIPVLVRANLARVMEINFVNRIQERMARFSTVIHPITGEAITLPKWDAILEAGDERAEVMRLLGKVVLETSVTASLPLNTWLRYRLPTGKGRKGPPMEIQIYVLSRLPVMVRDGFDSRPYTIDDLLPWIQRLTEETAQNQVFRLLLLASMTGWDNSAREVVLGQAGSGVLGMALVQRLGLMYLFDLPTGEMIYNKVDERTGRYAELFDLRSTSEEVYEVMQAIKDQLAIRDGLGLAVAVEVLHYSEPQIRHAFGKLAETGQYILVDVPASGLTLTHPKYSLK